MERPERPLLLRRRVWARIAMLLLVLWIGSAACVLAWALIDDARPADSIIVLGAAQYRGRPSPVLRTRLDHAVSLYSRGLAPRLFLTGGIGEGDSVSEAAAGRAYVISAGVSDTAVLLENEGHTSSESMRAVAEQMHARGLSRAIVVSDPFHMLRLEILSRRNGIVAYTSPASGGRPLWRQWGTLVSESLKAPLSLLIG